jgi:hypothetical protein
MAHMGKRSKEAFLFTHRVARMEGQGESGAKRACALRSREAKQTSIAHWSCSCRADHTHAGTRRIDAGFGRGRHGDTRGGAQASVCTSSATAAAVGSAEASPVAVASAWPDGADMETLDVGMAAVSSVAGARGGGRLVVAACECAGDCAAVFGVPGSCV